MESSYTQHGVEPNKILQSDYQFNHNGYGLLQLTANYAVDITTAGNSTINFARGSGLYPGSGDLDIGLSSYEWTCVKAEEKGRDGSVAYVTAYYAAIDPQMGGQISDTEASITSSAVSEPIETHPNFSQILCPQIPSSKGTPLGGKLGKNGPPLTIGGADNPYRAKWLPGSIPGALSYQFVGFLPQQKEGEDVNRKAGVKSWFRPSITMKLTAYTTNAELAALSVKYTGWIAKPAGFGVFYIPQAYQKITNAELKIDSKDASLSGGPSWLITSCNMEVYGGLFKVQADLLLSGPMGWDKDIYPEVPIGGGSPASMIGL